MQPKLKLLWLQGVTCGGDTHSFLNYPQLSQLLENFTTLYHPILQSTHSLKEVVFTSRDI
jgi:Ni,Fe-hydrogenase I small subunit